MARHADGAIVLVLAREDALSRVRGQPVFIKGIGWSQHSPNLEEREWHRAVYAELAAQRAYEMAGITDPAAQIDLAEVDDTFAYKELQHIEALRLAPQGESGRLLEQGVLPVNVSGGHLGLRLWPRPLRPPQRAGGSPPTARRGRRAPGEEREDRPCPVLARHPHRQRRRSSA